MRLSVKFPLLAILFSLSIFGIFLSSILINSDQRSDRAIVSLLEVQSELFQQMILEQVLVISAQQNKNDASVLKTDYERAVAIFENNLNALKNGTKATLVNMGVEDRDLVCQKPSKEEMKHFVNIQTVYNEYKTTRHASEIATGGNKSVLSTGEPVFVALNNAKQTVLAEVEGHSKMLVNIQFFVLCFAIVGIFFAVFSIRSMSRKIKRISLILSDYTQGNLTQRTNLEVPKDELDQILQGISKLGESIATIVGEIYSANNILSQVAKDFGTSFTSMAQSVEQTKNNTHTLASAATQASASVNSISQGSEKVHLSVETVATAMEEMTASISEVARQCQTESSIAKDAYNRVNNSITSIESLSNSSKKIGAIVKLINDIADKTNLLALNATIEAASAGDAGKGFAVVAKEVKNLAKQTSQATEEIRSQVSNMQKYTNQSVSDIKQIAEIIESVNTISHTIVAAVEQQSATVQEVGKNIVGTNQFAQQISHNIAETSKGIEEVTKNIQNVNGETTQVAKSISELTSSSQELKDLTSNLQKTVALFKIDSSLIQWNPTFSVGVEEIDLQHKRLFEIINSLNTAISQALGKAAVGTIISELIMYTKEHFQKEEHFMERFQYVEYGQHKWLHEGFVKKVVEFSDKFNAGEALLTKELLFFLKDWIVNHVRTVDPRYTHCFHKNGLK